MSHCVVGWRRTSCQKIQHVKSSAMSGERGVCSIQEGRCFRMYRSSTCTSTMLLGIESQSRYVDKQIYGIENEQNLQYIALSSLSKEDPSSCPIDLQSFLSYMSAVDHSVGWKSFRSISTMSTMSTRPVRTCSTQPDDSDAVSMRVPS